MDATIQAIQPYRTTRTDASGYFEFSLSGSEANTAGQGFAANFAVAAVRGTDRQLAVASRQFQFSNNDLREDVSDMRFWDAGAATVAADAVTVSWDAPPGGGDGGEHCVIIDLQRTREIDHVSIHGGSIIGLQDASVEVSVRVADGEWTIIDSQTGRTTAFDTYYRDLAALDVTADGLKIEVISQTDARFLELGEVVIHER